MARVCVRGVSKVFKGRRGDEVEALREVSFTVESNEFLCTLGPSGCGKSTLLHVIGALETPSAGEVIFQEVEGADRPLSNLVFQEFALFPWKTVMENVTLGLKLRGIPREERYAIARDFVRLMGLDGFEEKYPHQLSGGMKQRVSIARVLANDPEVILMDEPFASLDAQTRALLQEELLRIWETRRKTVCFVTHSIEEAILLGDRIVILTRRPGRVKEIVPVSLPRPRSGELRTSREFGELSAHVWRLIREEVDEMSPSPRG